MKTSAFGKLLAAAGAIAAVAAVCVSIKLDPPSLFKARALDRERLEGLRQIDSAIRAYYRDHKTLPERLDVVENRGGLSARSSWADPATHRPYEYDAVGKSAYRLCADFSADSEKGEDFYVGTFRSHHKGHDCFQEDVNAQ